MVARLGNSSGNKKTDLSNIKVGKNVRKKYKDSEIEQRARSIEKMTQLHPVILQPSKKFPGKYDLIAGFCRFKAHELLVSEGKDYNQIEYTIVTGDPFLIQLTENIQRSNLDSEEIEAALREMSDKGKKPQQIANEIDKPLSWVCDRLKADEVRSMISVDTKEISSSALSRLRNIPENEINEIIDEIKKDGGTVKAAKKAVDKIKNIKKSDNKKPSKNKDPFSGVYSEIKLLVGLDIEKKKIIDTIIKYMDGLK